MGIAIKRWNATTFVSVVASAFLIVWGLIEIVGLIQLRQREYLDHRLAALEERIRATEHQARIEDLERRVAELEAEE